MNEEQMKEIIDLGMDRSLKRSAYTKWKRLLEEGEFYTMHPLDMYCVMEALIAQSQIYKK